MLGNLRALSGSGRQTIFKMKSFVCYHDCHKVEAFEGTV